MGKLLGSDINDRYYVIVSIQQTMNSVTLMNSYRYRDYKRNVSMNKRMEDQNNGKDHKWKSFFKPFVRNEKENEAKVENADDGELELLRNKLDLQTKVSASLKIKYEAVMDKYKDMEQIKNK